MSLVASCPDHTLKLSPQISSSSVHPTDLWAYTEEGELWKSLQGEGAGQRNISTSFRSPTNWKIFPGPNQLLMHDASDYGVQDFQTFTDKPTNAGHANSLSLSLMNPFCSYIDCLTPALWYCWPICVLIYHESFLPPQFSIFFESDQVLSASQCVFISLTHTTTHTNTIS